MAEERFAELEQRIETLHKWRGELGEETADLHDTVTTLRGELAELLREAGAETDLRDGLVTLKERVDRIRGDGGRAVAGADEPSAVGGDIVNAPLRRPLVGVWRR